MTPIPHPRSRPEKRSPRRSRPSHLGTRRRLRRRSIRPPAPRVPPNAAASRRRGPRSFQHPIRAPAPDPSRLYDTKQQIRPVCCSDPPRDRSQWWLRPDLPEALAPPPHPSRKRGRPTVVSHGRRHRPRRRDVCSSVLSNYMCEMMACPNSEVVTVVAPSI